ncbi:MAG: biopolymer transporter ExbD [Candidatus Omnitrophica bacterium]|nr:biopolymer transporter ExbD [Candidatus Omnitrophota bacterium]MDD5654621.1 biopolymer transporter ExbD [Candidatus Omnitrophota bacterium]
MRFKRHVQLEHGLQQIDVVPLINTVFLLFIFFVFTSSFVMRSGMKVNLSRIVTSDMASGDTIDLTVSSDNALYLNGIALTGQELENTLRQISGKSVSLLIKADKSVPMGRVADIWNMCRELGISQVNIATSQ